MLPKLSNNGKQALMEQSLKLLGSGSYGRNSNVFAKILFTGRCFITLAELCSAYRFGLGFLPLTPVFCSIGKCTLVITFEKAQQLFRFLNPRIVVADNYGWFQKQFVELLEHSDCKIVIRLFSNTTFLPGVIERIWPRVVEMKIFEHNINDLSKLPEKHFDKLDVTHISSLDHLREALRHNVKELIFSIDTEPFEQAGFSEIQNFVPGKIESCSITFHSQASVLPFLNSLFRLLQPTLLHLGVETIYSESYNYDTVEEMIQGLKQYVELSMNMIEIFNETNIKLTIKNNFECFCPKKYLETDWIDQLKKEPFFKNFQVEFIKEEIATEPPLGSIEPSLPNAPLGSIGLTIPTGPPLGSIGPSLLNAPLGGIGPSFLNAPLGNIGQIIPVNSPLGGIGPSVLSWSPPGGIEAEVSNEPLPDDMQEEYIYNVRREYAILKLKNKIGKVKIELYIDTEWY